MHLSCILKYGKIHKNIGVIYVNMYDLCNIQNALSLEKFVLKIKFLNEIGGLIRFAPLTIQIMCFFPSTINYQLSTMPI